MPRYFLGIDVSTTAAKALAIDETGKVAASHSTPLDLSTPRPLWSEQDPRQWWHASCASVQAVLREISADDVACIGLTGQMHGLTMLDANNEPLRPAILWNDGRSGPQCAEITEKVGAHQLYQEIGSAVLPGLTLPKLMWVREHEPDVYKQTARVTLPKDYVRLLLTGAHVSDVADASGFALLATGKRAWSDLMLAACDIPRAWLPELCESPEVCAHVSAEGAAATGLRQGTPVVGGAGDQAAQATGMGIYKPGQTSITLGTSGVIVSVTDVYKPEPEGRLNVFCHALPGHWLYLGVTNSAAGSLRWLHDALAPTTSYDELSGLAAQVPRGADGLVFAPYLSGERHPHPDPLARGAFVGLTLRSSLGHMVRAVMEAVAYSQRDNLEQLRSLGLQPEQAAVSGGAANSAVWRQIVADIIGFPLYTVAGGEGAAYGAAVLAAVGAGAWPDVPTASAAVTNITSTITPDPTGVADYERLYPIFRGLYPALRDTFHALGDFEAGA